MNKVILIGNLGQDPETKILDGSTTSLTKFTLATNKRWKDKDGKKKEETQWHNIVAWNKLSEIIDKYCKKGDKIMIEGELKTRTYTPEGSDEKKYFVEIVANNMEMLGSKPSASSDAAPSDAVPADEGDDGDPDLPF